MGSGIQGLCAAFALHVNGYDVQIIEKANEVFSRTSLHQEGRVHMGFTYALDRTGETGNMMMHSALNFSGAMEKWLGYIDWSSMLLDKGYYLIHKQESLLSAQEVISYYDNLQHIYTQLTENDPNLSYFGQRPKKIFHVLDDLPKGVSDDHVARAILTEERIIEMFKFKDILIENINKRKITVSTNSEVFAVKKMDRTFKVLVKDSSAIEREYESDIVVNCLWNNRIKLDKTIGIETVGDPLYRFKVGLFGKIDNPLPNCTIISGAFGNVSPRMDGDYAYISWHVDSMRGMTTDGTTPDEWEEYFTKDPEQELQSEWVKRAIANMAEFVPQAIELKPTKLLPGIICSTGKTDIHDKQSRVHMRAEQMGIYQMGNYFSINTGKFSSAPLLADELIQRLSGHSEKQY